MPASRHRLHLGKLDDFAEWAAGLGFVREPTKGAYEVLRLRQPGKPPLTFYAREVSKGAGRPQHATVQYGEQDRLVSRWLWERAAEKEQGDE